MNKLCSVAENVRVIALDDDRRWLKDSEHDPIWPDKPSYSRGVNHAPITANATYSATVCDQLCVDGLTTAFIAPGSRSTPLALALVAHPGITTHIFHDERSAAFAALGHGWATGRPALILCSSGTAGAHFYAAVIEADASAVPLIAVTADRPPELWGRGAPQTIDQTHLYGSRVRDFVEPGPPDDLDPATWRSIARRVWAAATGAVPGPVHVNLSFRDPLTGTPDELPAVIEDAISPTQAEVPADVVDQLHELVSSPRGVIIAGRNQTGAATILQLANILGWPVLSDHRSGCRDASAPVAIRHFDSLLRSRAFTDGHRPEVVLRIGEIVSSKAVSQWLSACAGAGTAVISSRPYGRNIDPESIADFQFDEPGVIAALVDRCGETAIDTAWLASWSSADQRGAQAVQAAIEAGPQPNEIGIAQACVHGVPTGGALVASASMPIRDVEWFGPNRGDITLVANRGANGIDGVIATAVGVALTGQPTICLIGDVAFLHDSSTLVALSERAIDLTVVVTNNDGGAIFSFLPQHELLDAHEYEELFGTPHGTDLEALVRSHGIVVEQFTGVLQAPHGVRVVVAHTNRAENLELHHRVHASVNTALESPAG